MKRIWDPEQHRRFLGHVDPSFLRSYSSGAAKHLTGICNLPPSAGTLCGAGGRADGSQGVYTKVGSSAEKTCRLFCDEDWEPGFGA